MLNDSTASFTNNVISTISCADGSRFTVVSAKKTGPFFANIIYIPATRLTPGRVPITSKAGFTTFL
ncbi:hypothetical protein D3C78_1152350 [compost metagenome]